MKYYFIDAMQRSLVFVWTMRLLEKLSVVAKQRGMAESTIECYCLWVKQFLRFGATAHGKWAHPSELGTPDVEEFLNGMVATRQLAGSTQNQASRRGGQRVEQGRRIELKAVGLRIHASFVSAILRYKKRIILYHYVS